MKASNDLVITLKKRNDNKEHLMKVQREKWIDAVKGIGILLMILGHMYIGDQIRGFIYSFHMPMFVIISGYLFRERRSVWEITSRKTKSLLVPYVCFNLAAFLIRLLLLRISGYFSWSGAWGIMKMQAKVLLGGNSFYKNLFINIETVGPMWFVPFLFCINIMYGLYAGLRRGGKKNFDLFEFLLFFLLSFLGRWIGEKIAFLPWGIDCAFIGLFFFYIGVKIKQYDVLDKILENYKWITLAALFFWIISFRKIGGIAFATREYSHYPLCLLVAVAGSIVVMVVIKELERRGKIKLLIRFLAWIGENAMFILVIHSLDFVYINFIEWIQGKGLGRLLSYLIYVMVILLGVQLKRCAEKVLLQINESK